MNINEDQTNKVAQATPEAKYVQIEIITSL